MSHRICSTIYHRDFGRFLVFLSRFFFERLTTININSAVIKGLKGRDYVKWIVHTVDFIVQKNIKKWEVQAWRIQTDNLSFPILLITGLRPPCKDFTILRYFSEFSCTIIYSL